MNTKFKWLICNLFFLISFAVFGQKPADKYDFDFEIPLGDCSWICIRDGFRAEMDSVNKVHGKYSLLLGRTYLKTEFNLCIYQTILLPKNVKDVQASIFAQNDQLLAAGLKLVGLDKNGKVVACDSISLINPGGWQKYVSKISSSQGIDILQIEIRAKETFKEKKRKVKLWVDDLNVTLDGLNLLDCKDLAYQFSSSEYADIRNNVPLSKTLEIPGKEINQIKAKIVGFGETVHGSKEITNSIFDNIRQLVMQHRCRLVLFEIPVDVGIRLNQFVHEPTFDEDISHLLFGLLIDNDEFVAFIKWIKQYNAKTSEKVSVFGFDYYPDSSPQNISKFLISKGSGSRQIDSLLTMINSRNYRSIPLKFAIKHVDQIRPKLGDRDYASLIQYLKNRTDSLCELISSWQSSDWSGINRDYLLWQNTKFALENFPEAASGVAIYSHLSHLNKKTPVFLYSIKSLGQYIAESYDQQYFVIGMLVSEGKISTFRNTDELIPQTIASPPPRSIEYICSLAQVDNFYKTLPLVSSVPVQNRHIGLFYSMEREFIPSFAEGSMDAVIFIRHSSEATIYRPTHD